MGHALIVQDDADAARRIASLMADRGYSAATARSLAQARRQIALQPPCLLLLDAHLPDGNGLDLLGDRVSAAPLQVVLMTQRPCLDDALAALRLGVLDYLVKPVTATALQRALARLPSPPLQTLPARTIQALEPFDPERSDRLGHLVGRSPAMRPIYDQIARVAATSVTVFVTGESGTGKELVARTVHDMSPRKAKPFLAVNCGAISPHLIESEIFGHERGSFTGAERQHQGFFERAHGGTLFLDEITEMPPAMQVKLLRVLESGTFMRVGSSVAQESDVRLIAAANRDLARAVADGALREDLLYRLHVFPIAMPPLRDRTEDIPLLAEHFLRQIGQREGCMKRATPQALERLTRCPWPGNVRELRNVLQRAWVMATGEDITEEWLPPPCVPRAPCADALPLAVGTPLAVIERHMILATLEHCGHHKERTAAVLGISLKTLYNRLKAYGVPSQESCTGRL